MIINSWLLATFITALCFGIWLVPYLYAPKNVLDWLIFNLIYLWLSAGITVIVYTIHDMIEMIRR
jgi:hypothetical protein